MAGERLITDAEVLREILHRYSAIGRLDAIQPAYDVVHALVDEIIAIDIIIAWAAKDILLTTDGLSARGAIHLAAMSAASLDTIMTFDAGFDSIEGIRRLF